MAGIGIGGVRDDRHAHTANQPTASTVLEHGRGGHAIIIMMIDDGLQLIHGREVSGT